MHRFWITFLLFLCIKDIQFGKCGRPCKSGPPRVRHAILETIDYSGSILNYTCHPLFDKVKHGTTRCVNGTWRGVVPVCKMGVCRKLPPQVKNAILIKPDSDRGIILTYVCDQDYYKSEYGTIKCIGGEWLGKLPVCRSSRCIIDEATFPGIIPSQYRIYMHDEAITRECRSGFTSLNKENGVMRCFHGEWKGAIPPCVKGLISDPCTGSPPLINNGKIESFSGLPETRVNYVCDESFILKQSSEPITCQFGLWKGKVPECRSIIIQCPELEQTEGLTITYTNGRQINSRVIFDCNAGYRIKGVEVIVCEPNGIWSDSPSYCSRGFRYPTITRNPDVYGFPTATRRPGGFRYPTITRNPDVYGFPTATRRPVSYSYPTRYPEIFQCPELAQTEGLSITYTNGRHIKSIAMFYCDVDYISIGAENIVCQINGSWSESPAYCIPRPRIATPNPGIIQCPELEQTEGLTITYMGDRHITSRAEFHCDAGYRLNGAASIICQLDGLWSEYSTFCTPNIQCPELKQTEGLKITYTGGRHITSRAEFHCDAGYRLNGAASIICQPDALWSEYAAYCTRRPRITTPNPDISGCEFSMKDEESTPKIITERKAIYKFGEHVMFVCPRGKQLVPDIERVICMGAGWSDDFPVCQNIVH